MVHKACSSMGIFPCLQDLSLLRRVEPVLSVIHDRMFPCPLGGVVIDTPGMREMGVESADLSHAFGEIEDLAQHCRFRDCTHTNEPGCAVLAAVEQGRLDQRRLDSYRKLEHESSYDGLSSREVEVKKAERRYSSCRI